MNITSYFIKHPVLTIVLNAMILVVGILCFNSLSLREYPAVSLPKVQVLTTYPNASPETIETMITQVLEEHLSGIAGLSQMSSKSSYGASQISLTFKPEVSIDNALVAIRDAVSLTRLPQDAQSPIVQRKKIVDNMPFMLLSLTSHDSTMDLSELTHYANLHLHNIFKNIEGVASVDVWGEPYLYTIQLDPRKMLAFGINADDIISALKRAKISLPAGKFQNKIAVTLKSQLNKLSDYEEIIIKNNVKLKQIASLTLKGDSEQVRVRINGKPALCIAIHQAEDANPIEASRLVRAQIKDLTSTIDSNLQIKVVQDRADFVRASIKNVESSIVEAIICVLMIVFIFLRNMKATLIPLITIPISLVGSFIFLKIFGFSLNILSLLAMVLGIGLVVDDAIVMLENVHRYIEDGLTPLDATVKGAKEISFAIVAMTFTLVSVYAPLIFVKGIVGDLFIEFAVALAGSVLMSGVVALTLSPLMCSKLLKKNDRPVFPQFDYALESLRQFYQCRLKSFIEYKKSCVFLFVAILSMSGFLYFQLEKEMVPKEDRGLIGVYFQTENESLDFLEKKISTLESMIRKKLPKLKQSIVFMGEWGGQLLFPLDSRTHKNEPVKQILAKIRPLVDSMPSTDAFLWSWESGLPGIKEDAASDLSLVISSSQDYKHIFDNMQKLKKRIEKDGVFNHVRQDLQLNSPGYEVDLDFNVLANVGLDPRQVAKTIEVFFSGDRSLYFDKEGIPYTILIEGKGERPWDLNGLYLTNPMNRPISLGAVAHLKPVVGPEVLYHYNQMRAAVIDVELPKNMKLTQGMSHFLEKVNAELPKSYKKTWVGFAKSYEESRNVMVFLLLLALVFIFAILAVQFENFIDPVIILMTIPFAGFGALVFMIVFQSSFNIYTQIGLITLIGLISKHGILIVEFANQLSKQMSVKEAIIEAAALRLRPILMTTGAMLCGAAPLIFSTSAGYEAQRAIGLVLVGGLSIGTVFTLFLLPTMYCMIKRAS